jgi:transcriptional regulator with XRE-family HTH domain
MESKQNKEVVEIGKRIKSLIVKKKLLVRDVAHDANLDPTNLRKYIRGSREMRVTTVLRIAAALGVTAGELLNGLETKKEG